MWIRGVFLDFFSYNRDLYSSSFYSLFYFVYKRRCNLFDMGDPVERVADWFPFRRGKKKPARVYWRWFDCRFFYMPPPNTYKSVLPGWGGGTLRQIGRIGIFMASYIIFISRFVIQFPPSQHLSLHSFSPFLTWRAKERPPKKEEIKDQNGPLSLLLC